MNILIIGYGSIGKRHEEVISAINNDYNIHIVTQQDLKDKITFKSLHDIDDLDVYNYFIIASETYKHFEQLQYLDSKINNKKIFCEKPLFEKFKQFGNINNKIFVGYVLRFHPLLITLKTLIKDEKVIIASIQCGQYLPDWRKEVDYRNSYSAQKDKGGGVLLDLSHEIDYCQWLFGKLIEIKSYQLKISDLEIDSDDVVMAIGKSNRGVLINLSIDYISKITHRRMVVETNKNTYELDFISNTLVQKNKNGNEQIFDNNDLKRNDIFTAMHLSILDNAENACSFKEGLDVMATIRVIQEQNL